MTVSHSTISSVTRATLRSALYDRTTSPQRGFAAALLCDKWERGLVPVRMAVDPNEDGEIFLFVPFICPVNGNFYVNVYSGARQI